MDAQAINLQTFMKEKLLVNVTVILADRIVTENGQMRCFLYSTQMEGIGCIRTIRHWSEGTGLIFSDEPDSDLYSFLITRIDDKVVWHLTVNNTHLSLTMSPIGHVLCMAQTSTDDTTDFADIVQRKYFNHLATLYRQILLSLSAETQALKRYFANLVGIGPLPASSAGESRSARPRLFDDHPDFWFDHIKSNDGRPKRWIWTSPLSALTGLADGANVEKLQRNQAKIVEIEKSEGTELLRLDNKTNEILTVLKSQNEKVADLYKDESTLLTSLNTLMADEKSIFHQLAHVVSALEAESDVGLEFSSFTTALAYLPKLLRDVETLILSLTAQIVQPRMLPPSSNFSSEEILGAKLSAIWQNDSWIEYGLPRIVESFEAFAIRTIPFVLADGAFHRLKVSGKHVVTNDKGHYMVLEGSKCYNRFEATFCDAASSLVKVSATTCEEQLAKLPSQLPNICMSTMELTLPKGQEAIYNRLTSAVSLSTPYPDLLIASCPEEDRQIEAPIGVTVIAVQAGCKITSTELLIFTDHANSTSNQSTFHWDIAFSSEIRQLADDLSDLHQVNLSDLAPAFADFAQSVNIDKMDLAQAGAAVKQFQRIKSMESFNVAIPDLERLDNVTTTVAATAWSVLLLFVFVVVRGCMSCCCPNIKCCGKVCSLLWKLLKSCFSCLKCILCSCHEDKNSDTKEKVELTNSAKQDSPQPLTSTLLADDSFISGPPAWEIVVAGNRALLMATLESGEIFFNHLTGEVENEHGNELRLDIKPSVNMLNRYLQTVHSLPVPKLVCRSGSTVLEENPDVSFDLQKRAYIHKFSQKRVYGYKLPAPKGPLRPPRARADSRTDTSISFQSAENIPEDTSI